MQNQEIYKGPGRPVGAGGGKAPPLNKEEIKTLLRVTAAGENGTRNCALLGILLCGCRVSEPLSIRVSQVQDIRGKVHDSFILAGKNTKTGRTRRVFLNDQARRMLQEWISESGAVGDDLVFPLTSNYATTLVKQLMQRAGLKDKTSHSCRRTAATFLSENGVAVAHISQVLGHANIATTNVYISTDPKNTLRAVSTIKW